MPISISGSGIITGASSFASNTIFSGTVGVAGAVNTSSNLLVSGRANVSQGLTTASRGISNASVPSGSILQVVYARSNAKATTTSTTPVAIDSTLNLVITPTTITSKIFVAYHAQFSGSSAAYNNYAYIYRNSTQLTYTNCYRVDAANSVETIRPSLLFLDSPATTSSITYALYCSQASSSFNLQYNHATSDNGDWGYSYAYAMEIAG